MALKTILGLRYDLFISYRHKEGQSYASSISAQLKQLGFKVYLASEHDLQGLDDEQLWRRLRKALRASAAILHIGSRDPFGGEWVRQESDAFTSARFGLTIGLVTSDIPERDLLLLRMRDRYDSVTIYEEEDGAWDVATASKTTILNLSVAISLYKAWLRAMLLVWGMPQRLRLRAFYEVVHRTHACRKFIMFFQIYHGFVSIPDDLQE